LISSRAAPTMPPMTAVVAFLLMSWPILVMLGLLAQAAWRHRRREAMVARQVRLTDAIAAELGAIVAPVVTRPLRGPWRVEIRIPIGQPATVSRIVAIAHDALTRDGASRYELVLTPGMTPRRARGMPARRARRLQAA
jgi:hypothetical protein